jgi:hypothetical protein
MHEGVRLKCDVSCYEVGFEVFRCVPVSCEEKSKMVNRCDHNERVIIKKTYIGRDYEKFNVRVLNAQCPTREEKIGRS